jgi:hypothetical protein
MASAKFEDSILATQLHKLSDGQFESKVQKHDTLKVGQDLSRVNTSFPFQIPIAVALPSEPISY